MNTKTHGSVGTAVSARAEGRGPQSARAGARQLTWWILALPLLMGVAVVTKNLYLLDYSHVMAGMLWTGADLFLGFILGPVLRRLTPTQRQHLMAYLVPKTLLYMPTVAFTSVVGGWFLAQAFGFLAPGSPLQAWVDVAILVSVVLVVQGGTISWNEWRIARELSRRDPNPARIERANRLVFRLAAVQALLQVAIVLIMAHLTVG